METQTRSLRRSAQYELLQRLHSNQREGKYIQARTDHKVEGQDVHCRQCCFFAHDAGKFTLPAGKENHMTDQTTFWRSKTANGIVRSTKGDDGLHPGARHSLVRITCCTDNFVPLVTSLSRRLLHLSGTTPPGETLCQIKKWRGTMIKLLELFTESLIGNDGVLVTKRPLAGTVSRRETPLREQDILRLLPMREKTLTPKTKRDDSKPENDHKVFTLFPTCPNCEVCRMTNTTRARCKSRSLKRADGIPPPARLGELIPADHKILNVDD